MANTNAPFGFRQRSGLGSSPTYEQVVGVIAYNTAAIFYGDPVGPGASGDLIVVADQTIPIAGIFIGCKYLSVSQKRTVWSNYWPGTDVASTNSVEAYIVNDPNARFEAQSDVTGVALADINANVGFTYGTGNTANGISGAYLSSISGSTTTLPFRIISLIVDPPGSPGTASGAYNWVVVAFNNVTTKTLTPI